MPPLWRKARFFFYTESDQLARVRGLDALADLVDAAPAETVLLPHRVVPVPVPGDFGDDDDAAADDRARAALLGSAELARNGAWGETALDAAADACCFAGVDDACTHRRAVPVDDLARDTTLLRPPGGLALIPGEGNFLRMTFRKCAHAPGARTRGCPG